MVTGISTGGFNPLKLADLVTKIDREIVFTSEGQQQANEIVDKQIVTLFDDKMKRFSNQLTRFAKEASGDNAKLCKATEDLRSLCNKLNGGAPISKDDAVEMTLSALIAEAKKRQEKALKNQLANERPKLLNSVLTACKKQYVQKEVEAEIDADILRRISHIARIPLFVLGTAFQLAKTLFKAIVISVPAEIYAAVTKNANVRRLAGFTGVRGDLAMTIGLAIKTLGCFNPKKSVSFKDSCEGICSLIAWENKTKNTAGDLPSFIQIVSRIFKSTFYATKLNFY